MQTAPVPGQNKKTAPARRLMACLLVQLAGEATDLDHVQASLAGLLGQSLVDRLA